MQTGGQIGWVPPTGLFRWLAALTLGFTVLSLAFFLYVFLTELSAGALPTPGRGALTPYLLLPMVAAAVGYSSAAVQVVRRRPAWNLWLLGLGAHIVFMIGLVWVDGAGSASETLSQESWQNWFRLILPGMMIFMAERGVPGAPPPLPPR